MPELLVFAKFVAVGFIGAEIFRCAFYLGTSFANQVSNVTGAVLISIGYLTLIAYVIKRGALPEAKKIWLSQRIDLLGFIFLGALFNELTVTSFAKDSDLSKFHEALKTADPHWTPVVLGLLYHFLLSPLIRKYWPKIQSCWTKKEKVNSQLFFIADEEIKEQNDDLLGYGKQAKSFAEAVLGSGAQPGLIFGADGPWGIGKTGFINLAQQHWNEKGNKVIVCRFEPLRYASEPELTERLIRDVTATIQKQVFAPEFAPVATRYSDLIKGSFDFSILGLKFSFDPSQESVDDLLDDIDEVLTRIGYRIIIVIDDLDRLETKTVNNVLFATRRTLRLTNAIYILCYDTDILINRNEQDGAIAREFLEKFVSVKLNLFASNPRICDFLRGGWKKMSNARNLVFSTHMNELQSDFLTPLAELLEGNNAAKYLPLMGNMRKVKRFINALLFMWRQIRNDDPNLKDFNKPDLINLLLLQLNYPGLFRNINDEEADARLNGLFSLKKNPEQNKYENLTAFTEFKISKDTSAKFLLEQLFDAQTLDFGAEESIDESVRISRACFNDGNFRTLEKFLKLIVRFQIPEPQQSSWLYQDAIGQVQSGTSIQSILSRSDFLLVNSESANEKFWDVLIDQSGSFNDSIAQEAFKTLIKYLPQYSAFNSQLNEGLRKKSIFNLVRLLDRAGWGQTSGQRLNNTDENVLEIARRIFGEHEYQGKGLLSQLTLDRGPLGWYDLLLFRLFCSADRRGQQNNLHRALILHQDSSASTFGDVSKLALFGMRKISQSIFALFKSTYIEPNKNFLADAEDVPALDFLGTAFAKDAEQAIFPESSDQPISKIAERVATSRTIVKSFVIYQLSNTLPANGSGVGCGYYDEKGNADAGGISRLMNEYMFKTCFNPEINKDNAIHFLDHCLAHLSSTFFSDSGTDKNEYVATPEGLSGSLDRIEMANFWRKYRQTILRMNLESRNRSVYTSNYVASYKDDLKGVFEALDTLAEQAA